MCNFLGALPQDLFESAYLDGASHWTAFTKLALPMIIFFGLQHYFVHGLLAGSVKG